MSTQSFSILLLRWTLGLVVLWESWRFASSDGAAHALARMGLPHWIAPSLGGVEALAAVLFLLPKSSRAGGYLLLVVFVLAIALHVLHRQYDVGPLLIYGAATFACLSASPR